MVVDVEDIEPLQCQGLSKKTKIKIVQVAYLNTTFMEDARGEGGTHTALIGYCIVDHSSEAILIGKPTLDSLGFISDKHSIELRTAGIRFGRVLPEGAANREVSYLRLAENVAFEVPAGQSTTKTVQVVAGKGHNSGKWWSQPGEDLQPELQLVE